MIINTLKISIDCAANNTGSKGEIVDEQFNIGTDNPLFAPVSHPLFEKQHLEIHSLIEAPSIFKVVDKSTSGSYFRLRPNESYFIPYGISLMIGSTKVSFSLADSKCVFSYQNETKTETLKSAPLSIDSKIRLGRNNDEYQENSISIDDINISKKQVLIHVKEKGISITDLGSSNGTWMQFYEGHMVGNLVELRAGPLAFFKAERCNPITSSSTNFIACLIRQVNEETIIGDSVNSEEFKSIK